jgi:hypothetical protein
MDLAIDIGLGHMVHIDQRQRPTPLRASASAVHEPTPPTPTTTTWAARMRAAPHAVQALQTAKAALHICIFHRKTAPD